MLRLAIVEFSAASHHRALRILTKSASLFQKINNDTLKGCYYQTLGDVLENLWELQGPTECLDRALIEYAAASYHFEQAEHRNYWANVENNLGFLYFKINQCKEAYEHLDRARRIFASLKDKNATAQVDETRARVFLQENRNDEAEKVARSSVRILENSESPSLLAEALTTRGIALARLGYYSAAFTAFRRAIDLSQRIGSINRAAETSLTVFREMGERLAVVEGVRPISGRKLSAEVRSLEHDLIEHALEAAQGSVTHAARSLGMTHQALEYMLETRHKDLFKKRTPIRHRPKKTK